MIFSKHKIIICATNVPVSLDQRETRSDEGMLGIHVRIDIQNNPDKMLSTGKWIQRRNSFFMSYSNEH